MPKFKYIVYDKNGRKIAGEEEAVSSEELISRLQTKGFIVTNVFLESSDNLFTIKRKRQRFRHLGVSTHDLTLFCRQLATLLGAGVSLLKSIEIISEQVSSKRFYETLIKIKKDMEEGKAFHQAMAKHPRIFSDLWVSLVESGETSGNLAVILDRLAKYLERNADFKRKIISALIYPLILFIAGIGALLFLTIKIIPTFAQLFENFNIELPFLTTVLIKISKFLRKYFLLFIGGLILLFFIFRQYIRSKTGRRRWEKITLSLPLFGDFLKALIVERFSSQLSTLIESGVSILYSLEISQRSVSNLLVADMIEKIKDNVRQGKPLSEPLERSGFFDPMVVQMVRVGEEIGEVANMFKKINSFYQEYIETFLARFISLFEPMMIIFMAAVIGIIVIGMFLPIFQIAQIGAR